MALVAAPPPGPTPYGPSAGIGNIMAGLSLGGHLAGLSGRAVHVLFAILARYNFAHAAAWPSMNDLMARTGLSKDSVQRAIKDLEKAHLLVPIRIAGKRSRYMFPTPVRELAGTNPWCRAATNPPQPCGRFRRQLAAGLRHEQEERSIKQLEDQQQHPAPDAPDADVVVSEENVPRENDALKEGVPMAEPGSPMATPGAVLPMAVPTDLADLPAKHRGLTMATIRRLVGRHGVEPVRQAVAILNEQYPDDRGVKSYGALLTRATCASWTSPMIEKQTERMVRETAITGAVPPEGTNWVRWKGGSHVLAVVAIHEDRVEVCDPNKHGVATSVLPCSKWPEVEWFDTLPAGASDEREAEPDANDGYEPDPIAPELLRKLRGMAVWVACFKPGPAGLARQLASRGITVDEWEAFEAARELAARLE